MNPKDCRYTQTHEWAFREANTITVGLTAHAIEQLGDIVYLELPKAGESVQKGTAFGVIESVKAASDLFAPVSGRVIEVNSGLSATLDLFKSDPYGKAWLIRVETNHSTEYDSLLDYAAYESIIQSESH